MEAAGSRTPQPGASLWCGLRSFWASTVLAQLTIAVPSVIVGVVILTPLDRSSVGEFC